MTLSANLSGYTRYSKIADQLNNIENKLSKLLSIFEVTMQNVSLQARSVTKKTQFSK